MSLNALAELHHVACHQKPDRLEHVAELFSTRPNLETIDCYQQTREQMKVGIETIIIEAVPGSSLLEKVGDYPSARLKTGLGRGARLFQARRLPG